MNRIKQQMKKNKRQTGGLVAIVALLLLAGCGASKDAQKDIVWPAPPDEPRIKYVKTYTSEDDFMSGFGKVVQAAAGKSAIYTLQRPFDVAADDSGNVYVTDMEQGLLVFDEVKREVRALGELSSVPLGRILGVSFGNGHLYVGSVELGQVVVLTPAGVVVRTIGNKNQFPNPLDVVYDNTNDRIIVVDNKKHQLFVYSATGDSLLTIGERGEGDGEFNFPQSAAVDSAGNIYVVDAFNWRVQVFDRDGKFISKFGQQGNLFGMFDRPKGIALDTYGNIYVVDAMHNNFQVFNKDFDLLMFVGKYSANDNLGFVNPIGIYIDRNNRIYVADQLNERVQVFQLMKVD